MAPWVPGMLEFLVVQFDLSRLGAMVMMDIGVPGGCR